MTNPDTAVAHLELHFGALCHPLKKQFRMAGIKVDKADMDRWQRAADSITYLAVHQLLPDSAAHAARKRLMKKIVAGVNRNEK